MFPGGYESVDNDHFPAIAKAMDPIALNPEARYLVSKASNDGAELNAETRFGVKVSELLSEEQIASADAVSGDRCDSDEELAPGDVLSVLNYGFIEFMDVMGNDDAIADAARTSYTGGKTVRKNRGLLRYLLRHHHTTPFEMGELKFRLYIPIFVYRQLFRHRTASQLEPEISECITNDTAFQTFSVQNEMSGRYVEMPDHYFLPEISTIEKQSEDNKQGRSEGGFSAADREGIRGRYEEELGTMREWYGKSLEGGVAKELSRANLPLSQYTLLIWKIDLKNLLHFIALRIHPHAQYEVREYARALYAVVRQCFPITAEAFDEYMVGGARLTRHELEALHETMSDEQRQASYDEFCKRVKNGRERAEFAEKLGFTPAE